MDVEVKHDGQFKYGLLQVKIGTQHMLKKPGEKKPRGFIVRDSTRHPEAKSVVLCIRCMKEFPNAKTMLAAHPSHDDMVASEESHPWGYWSDEPCEPLATIPKEATSEERKALEDANAVIQKIGLMSDQPFG